MITKADLADQAEEAPALVLADYADLGYPGALVDARTAEGATHRARADRRAARGVRRALGRRQVDARQLRHRRRAGDRGGERGDRPRAAHDHRRAPHPRHRHRGDRHARHPRLLAGRARACASCQFAFPEIAEAAAVCRFRTCLHVGEAGLRRRGRGRPASASRATASCSPSCAATSRSRTNPRRGERRRRGRAPMQRRDRAARRKRARPPRRRPRQRPCVHRQRRRRRWRRTRSTSTRSSTSAPPRSASPRWHAPSASSPTAGDADRRARLNRPIARCGASKCTGRFVQVHGTFRPGARCGRGRLAVALPALNCSSEGEGTPAGAPLDSPSARGVWCNCTTRQIQVHGTFRQVHGPERSVSSFASVLPPTGDARVHGGGRGNRTASIVRVHDATRSAGGHEWLPFRSTHVR